MKKAVAIFLLIASLFGEALFVRAETYTLALLPSVGWSQYRVAEIKGFWEKQGVSVELVDYASPVDSARGGAYRRFDLTPGPMTYLVTFQEEGAFDAMHLGNLSISYNHKSLIVKKDLVNKSLKGMTIGNFMPCPANDFFIASYLKTVNTSFADIHQVVMPPEALEANFIENRLSALLTIEWGNTFYEEADGMIAFSTHEFYEPHGLFLIRAGGKDAIPADDLKKILRGVVDAIEWIRNPANWEEYKAILQEYYLPPDSPELSDEQLRKFAQDHMFVDPQTLLEHNQQRFRDYFAEYRAFLVSEESVNADVLNAFTFDNAIYNQPLIEVLQEYAP